METERSYTKSPIYKRWWYIVLIFISVLCSFINSIKPALFIFFSIVDCLLIVPILKNVYTKRKLKNKSISAFDIALAFAIIAIYAFVSAIVIAASYIGDDYYANADSIGTTYLMISAGAILISIACAIGGSVSAISRDGIRILPRPSRTPQNPLTLNLVPPQRRKIPQQQVLTLSSNRQLFQTVLRHSFCQKYHLPTPQKHQATYLKTHRNVPQQRKKPLRRASTPPNN